MNIVEQKQLYAEKGPWRTMTTAINTNSDESHSNATYIPPNSTWSNKSLEPTNENSGGLILRYTPPLKEVNHVRETKIHKG